MKAVFERLSTEQSSSFILRQFDVPKFEAPFHFHPEYELTLILKGEGQRYIGQQVNEFVESISKNAPAGSETAVNALKSGIAAGAAAINSMTKAAQQVAEFADSSVKAANSATVDAVKTAAKRSSAA